MKVFKIDVFIRIMLFPIIILLVGCGGGATIVAPKNNAVVTTAQEYRIRFDDAIPTEFTARINDEIIPLSNFTFEGQEAFVQIETILFKPGSNILSIDEPYNTNIEIYYDVVGPEVRFLSAVGDEIKTIVGYVEDASSVESLYIEGLFITLDENGNFSERINASDSYEVIATDIYGNVSTNNYLNLGEFVDSALSFSIAKNFIDDALPKIVVDLINNINFPPQAFPKQCFHLFLFDACTKFSINNISQNLDNDFLIDSSKNDQLNANVILNQLDLKSLFETFFYCRSFLCGGNGNIFGYVDYPISVYLRGTTATVDLQFYDEGGAPKVRGLPETFQIAIPNGGLGFDIGFGIIKDIPIFGGILNSILNNLFNFIAVPITNILIQIFDVQLIPVIENFINGIISIPNVGDIDAIGYGLQFEKFDIFDGDINLSAATYITVDTQERKFSTLGSRFFEGSIPDLGAVIPPSGNVSDINAILSVNFLNQLIAEAYELGLLDINLILDNLNSEQVIEDELEQSLNAVFSNMIVINVGDDLDLGDIDIEFSLSTDVIPYFQSISEIDSVSGDIMLNLSSIALGAKINLNDESNSQAAFNAIVDASIPLFFDVEEDNILRLGYESKPVIHIRDFSVDLEDVPLVDEITNIILEVANAAIRNLLPSVLDVSIQVPLPSILGYSILLSDIWNPTPDNNAFIALGLSLVSDEESKSAKEPIVYADVESSTMLMASKSGDIDNSKLSSIISLSGDNPTDRPLQYRYRVNDKSWTAWRERSYIDLSDLPVGSYEVDVCARTHMNRENCTSVILSNMN